jgi:hypothetical protein
MHLKVFVKLKKALKTLSSGQKTPKKPQKTHWAGFKKNRIFSNPDHAENANFWEILGHISSTNYKFLLEKNWLANTSRE